MKGILNNKPIEIAFFSAVAAAIYFAESMAMRAFPIPFLRLGLANVIILLLLVRKKLLMALIVNIVKTLIGGFAAYTLLSPATLISICGGITALLTMWIMIISGFGFSILGLSIGGAVMHNITQIFVVRWILIRMDSVYRLIPLLMIIGIITGIVTGVITAEINKRLEHKLNVS